MLNPRIAMPTSKASSPRSAGFYVRAVTLRSATCAGRGWRRSCGSSSIGRASSSGVIASLPRTSSLRSTASRSTVRGFAMQSRVGCGRRCATSSACATPVFTTCCAPGAWPMFLFCCKSRSLLPARSGLGRTRLSVRGSRFVDDRLSCGVIGLRAQAHWPLIRLHPQPLHLLEQPPVRDPQLLRRPRLHPTRAPERGLDLLALEGVGAVLEDARRGAVAARLLEPLGEEIVGDRRARRREQHGPLELVGELAHVPRERVAGEERERLLARLGDRLLHLAREPPEQVARERRDVLAPLAQRGEADREDAQAIVEVLAEAAGLHLVLEGAVGGHDDARIDRAGAVLAHRTDLPLLQHAEKLRLERRAGLRDLVEKERAAARHLEEALAILGGAREGAAAVAEELALEQALGERGTVDGDEEVVAARSGGVDGARHQLLAGTGLALEEDRGARAGDPGDQLEHVPHRLAGAHQLGWPLDLAQVGVLDREPLVRAPELLHQPNVLAHQVESLDRAAEREPELLALPRLGAVAVDAALVDRLDDGVDVGVAGQDDAHGVGADRHRALEEFGAAHRRHALVGDDHRRLAPP